MRRSGPFASGVGALAICPVCNRQVSYTSLRQNWRGVWMCPRHHDLPPHIPAPIESDLIALHHPQIGKQIDPVPHVEPSPTDLRKKPTY